MRAVPEALQTALQTGASTLCHCWRLTRQDGMVLGLTDHDADLVIDGVRFEAASGFTASALEAEVGLATGGGEIGGALSSERITPQEIEAGLFDSATLEIFLVNWQAPALDYTLDIQTLGEIRRRDGKFVAETRNAFLALDQEKGRLYTRDCDANLGDARCGVNVTGAPFRLTGTLSALPGAGRVVCPAIATVETGFFTRGYLRFLTGPNVGFGTRIKAHTSGGEMVLWQNPPYPAAIGDSLEIIAGCDKRFETCAKRFGNAVNFRGFPFLPAPEFIFAYARPGEGRHQGRPLVPSSVS